MIKLNPIPTLIALSLAGLVAGCASQAPSESANESANNAATGQSDVVSQTNPLDAAPTPAPVDATPTTPSKQYAQAQPAPMAPTEPAPAAPTAWQSSTPASTDMNRTTAPVDAAEEPLPPRADRN
ncbi:hypothetical protein ACG02S_06585 [Roseateles sp. DC23W]|uniref:Uncharacterized protein n=1 Tax=Pelomonas dachongensis TaxID=3299029 RepID=A0ABW7EJC1_9BURK